MPYQLEETGSLTRTAQVQIPADEYNAGVNRALRQLSKRVKIRGFRKGKIPISVMKQRYGAAVQRDVIEDLIRENLNQIIDDAERVVHVATPQVTSAPENGAGFEFQVDIELRPEIDPIGYIGLEVEKPGVDVTSDELEAELEGLRQRYATTEAIETRAKVKEGDVVTFDFAADASADPALEEFQGDGASIVVGNGQAMPGVEEAILGADFGSTVTAKVETDDSFQVPELRNKEFDVKITIVKVERQVLPELDDQFAKDTGEGETLLELRQKLRERIQHSKEHAAGHVAEDNLISKLLDANDIELPPAFFEEQLNNAIRNQLQSMIQQGVDLSELNMDPESMRENLREQQEKQIKTEFLLAAIAEKEGIQVQQEDLQAYFEHQAMHMGVPPQQLLSYISQDRDRMRQASASALLEKTVNHLLEKATIKEGDWPSDDAPANETKKVEAKSKPKKAKKDAPKKEAKPAKAKKEEPKAAKAAGGDSRAAFEGMKVDELKDILKANDLKVSGKKSELVDRLVEAGISA